MNCVLEPAKTPKAIKIILDTNFLLIPGQFKVDIFREIERICMFKYSLNIMEPTMRELENIAEPAIAESKAESKAKRQKGLHKQAARLALAIIKNKNINKLPSKTKYVDKAILDITSAEESEKYIVATQDIGLKKRLMLKGTKIISLRQKKYLVMQ